MRCIIFAPAVLLFGSLAVADDAPRLDLDRPGVLEQLKQQHPQRYQAVQAVLLASERAPCEDGKIELLKTRLNLRDVECGMMVETTYPALRRVRFELDGIGYAATVVLRGNDMPQLISAVAEQPAAR